jgi:hypothetical protein
MLHGDAAYAVRVARPVDTDAVSDLLAASYSSLLVGRYDSAMLGRALPQLTRANPTLMASGALTTLLSGSRASSSDAAAGRPLGPEGARFLKGKRTSGPSPFTPSVRQGVGTALLLRCLSDARRLGIRKVHCF